MSSFTAPIVSSSVTPTLADVARAQPWATRVFLRHGLDFCCGGHRTLAEACARAGLDPAAIQREIDEADRAADTVSWEHRGQSELADHIEHHYHAALRRDMPALIAAARRVEKVHASKPEVPTGLAGVLDEFWQEMQDHMAKEEAVLFPLIRRGVAGPSVHGPVHVLEREHALHGATLAGIRHLTGNLTIPAVACATWAALYRGLEALEAELMEHIHLENNILFARAAGGAT